MNDTGGPVVLGGSCLCGAVRYTIDQPLRGVTHCHCGQCRKAHGAAFASYVNVRREVFAITQGEQFLGRYASSAGVLRSFCRQCGSSLTWESCTGPYPEWLSVALGTLDTPVSELAHRHIYLDSRAPWEHFGEP